MARRLAVCALLALGLAYVFTSGDRPLREPYVQGRNKTVLFMTNCEHGLTNVHLATSLALLEHYPDIDVHYASFAGVGPRLARISSSARHRTPSARDMTFHQINSLSFAEALVHADEIKDFISPPASAGIASLAKHMQLWISPWSVEHHLDIFQQLSTLIDEVDPAVVVLDTWLRPAIDATRDKNRQHAFVTPNILADNFLSQQPFGSMFWKYPAAASGFPFPVPWRKVLENAYLNARFLYGATMTPALAAKKSALRKHGLKDPINFFGIHRPDVPWITQTTEDATVPLVYVPPNVTCAGPIVLSGAPAAQQDPELAAWLKNAPTVLINLGSNLAYDEQRARAFSGAIAELLDQTKVQILWKFNKLGDYSDDALLPLERFVTSGRVRMPRWLTADPSSLLETGDIVVSVHHGGSNCYHETLAAGVVQVALPLWSDLYNFAALIEDVGVGVWACRETSPAWTSECLSSSLLRALDGGDEGSTTHDTAKTIGHKVRAREKGRDVAAREIAKLAYVK